MEGRKINNISAFTYGKYMRTEKVNLREGFDFKQGDTLKGRVIRQDLESNKLTIKLTNGLEIEAEIQGEVDLKDGILKFEVAGLKDNTLFLKLAGNNTEVAKGEGSKDITDEIMNFILKEGLKKEDYNMLKAMVKYNIPLTRENITTVKSIMEFSHKMNNKPAEIKSFINSYLNSRDIVADSREGLQAAQKLFEFFEAFSKSELQEVLLFLENDLEFTKENLDSFNKLFNSENTIEKVLEGVNEKLGDAIAIDDDAFNEENVNKQTLKQLVVKSGDEQSNLGKGTEAGKTILATFVKEGAQEKVIANNMIMDSIKNEPTTSDNAKEIPKLMKNNNEGVLSKETLKESIVKLAGREVVFEKELASNDIRNNIFNISKNLAKNVMEKAEGSKEVIRSIISSLKEGNENSAQILNIMKNSINDLKLFNKINDQYYCLDVPVNFKENEYPCKLIIKDDRKDGKVIDSSNFKVAVSVKTVKLGTVDALLDVKNRNIHLQLKCDKNVMSLFIMSKDKLKEIVESSGFTTKIEIAQRTEELQLSTCREFFNDNNIAAVDITV